MNNYLYDLDLMSQDSSYGCFIIGFKIGKYATKDVYSMIGAQAMSTSSLVKLSKVSGIQVEQKIQFNAGFSSMLASEESLKKEWLLPEEDEAWKDL